MIDLTIAMVDRVPGDSYDPLVKEKILMLEKIGEVFIAN
jgi:hypothetical protein